MYMVKYILVIGLVLYLVAAKIRDYFEAQSMQFACLMVKEDVRDQCLIDQLERKRERDRKYPE